MCKDKNCREHWTRYSEINVNKLVFSLVEGLNMYCFTFPCPKKTRNFNIRKQLEHFIRKIKPKTGSFAYCWVRHWENNQENYHGFIISQAKIDEMPARASIINLTRRWGENSPKPQECYFKALESKPEDWLAYLFGIGPNGRDHPPWLGLHGKSFQTSKGYYKQNY